MTLRLFRDDDGIVRGRVITLAIDEAGEAAMMSTAASDPPISDAIKLACDISKFKEEDVDVLDPEDLWDRGMGELR